MTQYFKELTWAAITVYHESLGEPFNGKVAVAHVIFNRSRSRGLSISRTVLQRNQFSCYNDNRRPPVKNYDALGECLTAVLEAQVQQMKGETMDNAMFYLNKTAVLEKCGRLPSWVSELKEVCSIRNHTFYRGDK